MISAQVESDLPYQVNLVSFSTLHLLKGKWDCLNTGHKLLGLVNFRVKKGVPLNYLSV